MKNVFTIALLFTGLALGMGQTAPNFTFTDVTGKTHKLHEDYLDKGKIVVAKVFFVNCPPCNSAAPGYQAKYVSYGSGTNDVQFIELSNKVTDNNNLVNSYKNQHSITFPIAGAEGGSVAAQASFTNGIFGTFFGTPHYTVFAPDKKVYYDVSFNQIDATINEIRNSTTSPGVPVKINTNLGSALPTGLSVMMKPKNSTTPILNITQLTNGSHSFEYPSANFPEITEPVLYLSGNPPANTTNYIRANDLIALRKHILGLELLTDPKQIAAGDVTGDDRIRSGDVVEMRKVILGLTNSFDRPSYFLYPNDTLPLTLSGSGPVDINLEIVRTGNILD